MATNDEIKLEQTLLNLVNEGKITREQALQIQKEENEERKKSIDYQKEQLENLKYQKTLLEEAAKQSGISVDFEKKKLEYKVQELEIDIKEQEIAYKNADTEEKKREALEQIVNLQKEQSKEIEKQKDLARAEQAGGRLANLLGISEANKNSLTYQLFSNPQSVFDGFKKEINDAGGVSKAVYTSIAMKVQEAGAAILLLSKQQMALADTSVSSFYAATGATEAYTESIYAVARGNTAMGIGFAESGKAMTTLYENLNTFTNLSKSSQQELAITTAKLEKLGISGGDTAKSIMTLSEMMQISETQAAGVVEEFAAMGQAIGVSSKQMIADFAGVKDQLAVFGSEMGKVFKDLEAQSKATGVSVSDLLNLTNKFDTFSSAANQVGKLNAILGGPYLSTMAMIQNTDPTERINMLRQAVDNAGVSFNDMSYYEKKAIMEAGGFKSVEEAQRVLSMSAGEYANKLKNQEATQKQLNDAIERAQPINEKLSLIMANLAIVIGPLVTFFSKFLSVILEIQDVIPGFGIVLGVIAVVFGIFLTSLPIIISLLGSLATIFTALSPAAAATGPAVAGAATAVEGAAATLAAASPIIVEGAAALGILALAFLGVGAAILLAGLGIKMMFEGLASLIEQGVKAPEVFLNMASAILALSIALNTMGNPLALLGMGILVTSLYSISDAINSIETEKVINFKVMMEKIVEISEPTAALQFSQFKEDFQAVAEATAKFEIDKANSFTNLLTATQNLSANLQLKQDIKVLIDGQELTTKVQKRFLGGSNAATSGTS